MQLAPHVSAVKAAATKQSAASAFASSFAAPLAQLEQRAATAESDVASLQAIVGEGTAGDLRGLETKLAEAEAALKRASDRREELMALKEQLTDDKGTRGSTCVLHELAAAAVLSEIAD